MGLTITLECLHPLSPSNYCITVQSCNGNAGNERQEIREEISLSVSDCFDPELFFPISTTTHSTHIRG